MSDEELIARLRAVCTCNIDSTPCMAEDDCRDALAAADRIEALERERDQWIEHTKNAVWADSEELKLANARAERLEAAASSVADDVCSYICPSVGKAGEPILHDPRCIALRAALKELTMSDEELIARLRKADEYEPLGHDGWAAADRIEALVKENAELQQTFDMQWNADMRAIKMWQEAHPGNDLVWPDGAKLTVWLMERVDALKGERDRQYDENVNRIHQLALAEARAERLEAEVERLQEALVTAREWVFGCTQAGINQDLAEADLAKIDAALKGDDHV